MGEERVAKGLGPMARYLVLLLSPLHHCPRSPPLIPLTRESLPHTSYSCTNISTGTPRSGHSRLTTNLALTTDHLVSPHFTQQVPPSHPNPNPHFGPSVVKPMALEPAL